MDSKDRVKINHDKESVRLFSSDILEFFTHVHPLAILIIWLPVAAYFLYSAIRASNQSEHSSLLIGIGVLLGLFLWTAAEYLLHRFVFHFRPRNEWQKRWSFLAHGVHHLQPQQKTRLVMPPVVSIPLALLFYALFYLVFDVVAGVPQWIAPTFSGFILGYLTYDMLHYATHHIPMRRGVMKALKQHHMRHHYKSPNKHFGVSSPLWDRVFGT